MKKIFLIIAVLFSVSCFAQKEQLRIRFIEADSSFTQMSDSLKFNQIIKEIEADTTALSITIDQFLLMYFNGYINGSCNYKQKGSFDLDRLLIEIKANRQSIKRFNKYNFSPQKK